MCIEAFKKYPEYFSCDKYVDKTRNVEKANNLYNSIESKFQFNTYCSLEFIEKTKKEIHVICEWKAGRKLFKEIFLHVDKIRYAQADECGTRENYIQMPPTEENRWYISVNEENDEELHLQPNWMPHVHEVIHVYRWVVDPNNYGKNEERPTLDPRFDNLEEQIVISGFDGQNKYHSLNENLFHYLSETPLRSDHRGGLAGKELNIFDYIKFDAVGSLKKIECDINELQFCGLANRVHLLTFSCTHNSKKAIDFLIDKGANVRAQDDMGNSPLHAVASSSNNNTDMIQRLVDAGADVHCRDSSGNTPLMRASNSSSHSRFLNVEKLIKLGADINCQNGEGGDTPLVTAIRRCDLYAIEYLLELGADANYKINVDDTPMTIANQGGDSDVIDLLVRYG